MNIGFITLFPEMFQALNYGIVGKAQQNNLLHLHYWNPRDFTHDPHHRVDDRPYGGGPGMVMKVEPLLAAIDTAKQALPQAKAIYLSPQGKTVTQTQIQLWSNQPTLLLLAGRYEGVDERILELAIDEEWSIGDYVLSGGELAAMVLTDAITRCLPGSLGAEESHEQDSFTSGLLDYPHYTRPELFANKHVPEVLLRGNHQAIQRWRMQQALGRTWLRRPDLLANYDLSTEQRTLLNEYQRSRGNNESEE